MRRQVALFIGGGTVHVRHLLENPRDRVHRAVNLVALRIVKGALFHLAGEREQLEVRTCGRRRSSVADGGLEDVDAAEQQILLALQLTVSFILTGAAPREALASSPALDHFAGETSWVAARIGRLRRVTQVGSGGFQMRLGAAPRILGTGAHLFVEHVTSLGLQPRIAGRANGGAKKQAAPQHHGPILPRIARHGELGVDRHHASGSNRCGWGGAGRFELPAVELSG